MKLLIDFPMYIPDWAKYLTIDEDGSLCIYDKKPYFNSIFGEWDVEKNDKYEFLYKTLPPKDASKEYYILEWVYI